jgi:hypothetical protein
MSSSTSISDTASDGRRWRRLLRLYAAITSSVGLALGAALLLLDPYDTGHFALFPTGDVANYGTRLALASIGRRPEFDTAVVGNSTIQLLDPARLSRLSRRHVVSLAVAGSGPLEQLAVADWFRRNHRDGDLTLMFGIDATWCTTDDPIRLSHPFPFWLYTDDRFDYAINMMRYKTLEAAGTHLRMLFGNERKARADGYHDYSGANFAEFTEQPPPPENPPGSAISQVENFTAPPLLRQFLERLGGSARVVLLMPPRHVSILPVPGSRAAAKQDACKAAYRALADMRPNTRVLDFDVDGPMARAHDNFWDAIHYRDSVARKIEDQVAAAIKL